MKTFCIALTIAAAIALPARAVALDLYVANTTGSCAFVSASYSTGDGGFGKLAGTAWLHPHATISFHVPYASKIHVNAQVHAHGHCGGQGLYNTYDEKGPAGASAMTFELMPGNGREWLWFKHFGQP